MIQATTAIGDFMLILVSTALFAAAQLGAIAVLGLLSVGGAGWSMRRLWRRFHP